MKKFKYLLAFPLMALTAFVGTSCDDEEETARMDPPSIEVGEVTLASATEPDAVVTVTPSANTETWYWKCEETGASSTSYTAVEGNEETRLTIPIRLDTDYTLTVYAENSQAKSEEVTKEFNIASASVEGDLVTFEIKHLSALSVDVEVSKSVKCSRYAIGAVPKYAGYTDSEGNPVPVYDESDFIESAKTSLDPNPDYPYQSYNTSDESGTFTELTLLKGSAKADVNTGLMFSQGETYVVAVYALDANGEGTLYTQEFDVPEMDVTKGQVAVDIRVTDEDMTQTSVSATFSASADCAKIITSIVHKSTLDQSDFDSMTPEEQAAFLAGNTAQVPQPYTGEFRRTFDTAFSPDTDFVIWAVPVDTEGNIGQVAIYEGATPGMNLSGTGRITAATVSQTTYENVDISLTLNEDARQVRLLFLSTGDFNSAVGSSWEDLEWIMSDADTYSHLWTVYEASQAGDIVIPVGEARYGASFYIYAVTVDANGGISEVQNIVTLAGGTSETYATLPEPSDEGQLSFDGTGEITFTVISEEDADGSINLDFKIEKGSGTVRAWYMRDNQSLTPEQAVLAAQQTFADSYPDLPFMWEATFDADGSFTGRCEYMLSPGNGFPGEFLLVITQDAAGAYSVAHVYEAGSTLAQE